MASVAAAILVAANSSAQHDGTANGTGRPSTARAELRYGVEAHWLENTPREDFDETRLFGGFVFAIPNLGLEIRGTNALILTDIETRALLDQPSASGLPRRGIEPPAPRRHLSGAAARSRIERTMQTFGNSRPVADAASADRALDLVRFLYFEGGILVLRDGVELLRSERLWIAPLEDRVTAEEVELRYVTAKSNGEAAIVVRAPKLTKIGSRWTGRDLSLTTCTAAEPHFALALGEAEIIERDGELEVRSRGQHLQLGGVDVLPLPDAHFFTGSQSQFPIKRASLGYSGKEGIEAEVVVGLPWNTTGGQLHHWLTGREADEFRGNWELGVGFVAARGVPLRPAFDYRVPGLYEGRTEAFWLDDSGRDRREIQANLDGSPIDARSRGLIRSQNRIHLGDDSHVDLQAFSASDPAVLSEFHAGDYRNSELPETSGYLHHQTGNHLITFGARTNLDDFSYRDNRSLAPRFIEELPVLTWHWLAETLGETPWETPIVLDVATELGQRRSDFDPHAAIKTPDRTFRADQHIELSAPFALGALSVRPFLAARGTYYDNSIHGGDESRIGLEGGVQLGTRMSRVFQWTDDQGSTAVRHVMAPRLSFMNRFHVDDRPGEFHQFDATDALTERQLVRVELRNLLQHTEPGTDATASRDFLMLDLAQDFWPDAARDNAGDNLGLFYYDLMVRPRGDWLPFGSVSFALYGDHDWRSGLRTLDCELQFGPIAGVTWSAEYRTDRVVDGAVGVSASTVLYDRWSLFANSLYDLQNDRWLTYGFGLQRHDHDWSIALSGGFDPFTDQTTFRVEFVPIL
ncbi:MAG: LPS assembly protein LptD [Planctomycetes bacterium]|nr:LPS assembly protein LptD [Planctomycetota bacterium]